MTLEGKLLGTRSVTAADIGGAGEKLSHAIADKVSGLQQAIEGGFDELVIYVEDDETEGDWAGQTVATIQSITGVPVLEFDDDGTAVYVIGKRTTLTNIAGSDDTYGGVFQMLSIGDAISVSFYVLAKAGTSDFTAVTIRFRAVRSRR